MVGAGVELRAHALGDRLLAADYDAAVGELAVLEAVLAASGATAGFYASTRIV